MTTEQPPHHRLIESHLGYAHAIAADVLKGLPSHVEKAEIQAAAELGLTEAATAYDGRPGVQFKTFAYYRIRGAVYDAIRKATWFSRTQYQELLAEAAVNDYMADSAGSEQSPVCDSAELERHTGSVVSCYMLSLEGNRVETPVDTRKSAEENLIEQEWHNRLHQALPKISGKNRAIIQAYYFEGKTLEEIGAAMGLSKSWVCRLHAKGIEMLRDLLAAGERPAATLAAPAR
jgi:RNA polymerase sigma factor FliA